VRLVGLLGEADSFVGDEIETSLVENFPIAEPTIRDSLLRAERGLTDAGLTSRTVEALRRVVGLSRPKSSS
jgi:hypothetical protein